MPDDAIRMGLSDDGDRSPVIARPSGPAITYRKQKITPGLVMRLWRSGQRQKQKSRERILESRSFRRMEEESRVKLASAWTKLHPEAAEWVVEVLEERITLDSNMIARSGAVEPEFSVAPIATEDLDPFTQTAHDLAEAREAYLEEWRKQSVPFQVFIGKGTEDGEYARVTLPAHLDMDGEPDFFETIDERAYGLLDDEAKKEYDEDDDHAAKQIKRYGRVKRKKYVRMVDDPDLKAYHEREGREAGGRTKKVNPRFDKGDKEKNEQAHRDAITRYLLDKDASNTRVVPALDCAPIFDRGKKKDRWALSALVERTLFYVEELLEQDYGWTGMGDRKVIPCAYTADGQEMPLHADEIGEHGQFYLYTAYLVCKDDEGHERPVIAYTIGGASTTLGGGEEPGTDDHESVGLIDLYEETKYTDEHGRTCGLEGALWSYHGGLHGEDDDPDHYWRPYIYPFIRRIRAIEGNKTAMNAANEQNSFTGYTEEIDAALAEAAPESILDAEGELIRNKVPGVGEIAPVRGKVSPFQQARIGVDAWQMLAADYQALQMNTAIDQLPGGSDQSGHAMLVQSSMGQVGKRHIREGALAAVVRSGEDHLRILDAIYHKYDIRWPLQTIDERPVGDAGEKRAGVYRAEYDPRWLGEGNFKLRAEYPEEENLARIDLEASLADRGYGNVERVHKAMGEPDSDRARLKSDRDFLLKQPPIVMMRLERVAKKIGDRDLQKLLQLQAQEAMSKAAAPGLEGGIPTSALSRQGQGSEGAGPGPAVSGIRGGIEASQIGGDRMAADAEAMLTQQGGNTAA